MSLEGKLFCVLEGVEHPDEQERLDLWFQPPNRFHLMTLGHEGYEAHWRFDVDLHVFLSNLERAIYRGVSPDSLIFYQHLSNYDQVQVIHRDAWQQRNQTNCGGIRVHAHRDPSWPYSLFFDFYQQGGRTSTGTLISVDAGQEMYVTRQALWEMINRINSLGGA